MSSRLRRNFSGAFLPQDLQGPARGDCRGRLRTEIYVYLRGAEHGAQQSFGTGLLADLGIEWHAEKVLLTFMSGEKGAGIPLERDRA